MKQIIVYKDKPASINNKNDNAKTAYQNSISKQLKRSSKSARCFYHGWRDLVVDILWRQSNPADIDNIIKYTLDTLKGICYNDDKSIIKLT
ncbi:RusA family crossover junction endodeoxyribonuclease [Campylobacter lanienae]|uniref:RusA family crossover junction endodeoxyribonuclease n=1 Tax=Campylobacter lanienae TaxID=75658 RepID=UPI00242DED63|nr:RusA family crossover junction endodeoxyribonuclease [Campylobacter lanienae]MCI5540340.1 RusA family crossover junction endodeoxyribonuclease [Campylobacter lanienae]MDY5519581.1 RusA family crossover junction endodeoxyribonuclease [Campylobacter lanienae]